MKRGRWTDPFRETLGACRQAGAAAVAVSFFVNILMLTTAIYMIQVYDRVLASKSDATLLYLTFAALVALAALAALDHTRTRILSQVSVWMERRLGPRILSRAVDGSLDGRQADAGSLRDLSHMRQFIASPGAFALLDIPWTPIYLIILFFLHPWIGSIGVVSAGTLLFLAYLNDRTTRAPLKAANEVAAGAARKAEHALRNADAIAAMGMIGSVSGCWMRDNDRALALQALASDRSNTLLAVSKFLRLGIQIAVLGTGAYLAIRNEMTAGAMIAGSILLARALQPVEQSIAVWRGFTAAREAALRLAALFAVPLRTEEISLPRPQGALSVEKLTYIPPGGAKPVLKAVEFTLGAGQSLAVVGPSAAGKSTLARLLVGSRRPSFGAVRLDGAEVASWNRAEFGRHVGYLPQDVELFEGSVADNIARLGEVDEDAVVRAATRAGAHETILALPEGYRTEVGVGGCHLSGGQRQRIGLARALYGDPALAVLDEPSSNLDSEGEAALIRALDDLKRRGVTTVVVAHRPHILTAADYVLFLRDGAVELFGRSRDILPKLIRPAPSAASQDGGAGEASLAGGKA